MSDDNVVAQDRVFYGLAPNSRSACCPARHYVVREGKGRPMRRKLPMGYPTAYLTVESDLGTT